MPMTRRRCTCARRRRCCREFEYLGEEKAQEVVIHNTVMIADVCETHLSGAARINVRRSLKIPTRCCVKSAMTKRMRFTGEQLPEIVTERLERELNSIISNGYAVMYIIAQKLVWKSNEDGYLVGSRGSVGSSFVATMSGITEVNPLSPHYYCVRTVITVILILRK